MTARIVIIALRKSEHCESPELDFSAILWYTIYRAKGGARELYITRRGAGFPRRSWKKLEFQLNTKAETLAGAESKAGFFANTESWAIDLK